MGPKSPSRTNPSDVVPEGGGDVTPRDVVEAAVVPEGADAACWAHIVCPECGSVLSEEHRSGCSQSADS